MKIIAADIGGTSSRFAFFESDRESGLSLRESTWLRTGEASAFAELLSNLEASDFPLSLAEADICVFAVAGPVERNAYAALTNVPWNVDLAEVGPEFGMQRYFLMNDFLAQAFAACSWIGKEAPQILGGTAVEGGAIAVLGAGTGLGKALLVRDKFGRFIGSPSEGGHACFAAEREEEFKLQEFIQTQQQVSYATWEMVVSGGGLSTIHQFLTGERLRPEEVAEKFTEGSETLEWAARFYGRACRNFALETLSLGGVFIAGGVAAKNPILVKHPEFEKSFRSSPRHAHLLADIPVFLMSNEESGLWGAGFFGAQELAELINPPQ